MRFRLRLPPATLPPPLNLNIGCTNPPPRYPLTGISLSILADSSGPNPFVRAPSNALNAKMVVTASIPPAISFPLLPRNRENLPSALPPNNLASNPAVAAANRIAPRARILTINLENLPNPVPKIIYADNNFGQLLLKNLTMDLILLLLSGLLNQSTSFIRNFPNKMLNKKPIILSKIPLTGWIIFSATFLRPSNLFAKFFFWRSLLSLSAFFLSKVAASLLRSY